MKTLIIFMISFIIFTGISHAHTKKISSTRIDHWVKVYVICVDGYKYLSTVNGRGISTIQIMDRDGYPIECN